MANIITELKELNSATNNGLGTNSVDLIIVYLESGDVDTAKAVYTNEYDRLQKHETVFSYLKNLFGCRMHYKKECEDWICKEGDING